MNSASLCWFLPMPPALNPAGSGDQAGMSTGKTSWRSWEAGESGGASGEL